MKTSLKAIIADDEPALRAHLRGLLATLWPALEIVGETANGLEAVELLERLAPDVAFLDIRMPGLSGLEAAQRAQPSCALVFVTAYDQYAVEAFEKAAVDYLLKPVSRERLEQTVARLKERLAGEMPPPDPAQPLLEQLIAALTAKQEGRYLQWIRIAKNEGVVLIPVGEVQYFEACDKYTLVKTAAAEELIRKSIKQLQTELDPDRFWQIHRKTIVNVDAIARVERLFAGRHLLRLKNREETLTVSRAYGHLFRGD